MQYEGSVRTSSENVSRPPATAATAEALIAGIPRELPASIRVLVADADRATREGCSSLLQANGFTVVTCPRGDEAIELLRRSHFDVVLADLDSSPVTGMHVLE